MTEIKINYSQRITDKEIILSFVVTDGFVSYAHESLLGALNGFEKALKKEISK